VATSSICKKVNAIQQASTILGKKKYYIAQKREKCLQNVYGTKPTCAFLSLNETIQTVKKFIT